MENNQNKIVNFNAYNGSYTITNPRVDFKHGYSLVETNVHIVYRVWGGWHGEDALIKGVINENYEPVIPFSDEYQNITIVDKNTILTSKYIHGGDGEQSYTYLQYNIHVLTEKGFVINECREDEYNSLLQVDQRVLKNNN